MPDMIIWRQARAAATIAIAVLALACDSGSPSKTADDIAADSALAADLALANRDTLLVDSIGAYREPAAAEQDTAPASAARDSIIARDNKPSIPATQPGISAPPATTSQPASPPPANPPAATSPAAKTASAPPAAAKKLSGTRACTSPTQENQSECIRVLIAAADARLNRTYRALISEMRRQENVAPGAKDPPSVEKLRIAQRSWLVYRDNECRKRGRGKEGKLWARPRAKCLGEFSARRANELADDFIRLTAH
ncbi:MAG TPA: lysozyme inhibitor LprI family protein [Gemmatimonadaceae bacterium]|nr:lysozyme inhibitor LprI family protein [Gemmatimonadaceae bacterium]